MMKTTNSLNEPLWMLFEKHQHIFKEGRQRMPVPAYILHAKPKKKCRTLLYAMLPDTLSPTFCGNTCSKERQFLANTTTLILSRDNHTDLEMVTDMRRFNCRGNNDLFEFFCSGIIAAMYWISEMEQVPTIAGILHWMSLQQLVSRMLLEFCLFHNS